MLYEKNNYDFSFYIFFDHIQKLTFIINNNNLNNGSNVLTVWGSLSGYYYDGVIHIGWGLTEAEQEEPRRVFIELILIYEVQYERKCWLYVISKLEVHSYQRVEHKVAVHIHSDQFSKEWRWRTHSMAFSYVHLSFSRLVRIRVRVRVWARVFGIMRRKEGETYKI